MFQWFRESSPDEKKTFWGCFGGWALDALDVQLFSLAIPALMETFGLARSQAGLVSGVTLVSSALGGWVMGVVSDRRGRVFALQVSVACFSVFTFLGAFAQDYAQLLILKALQGFGFGGEWAAGAVLMAEVIRPERRGRAMGTVQSAWAVGWGAAVLLYVLVFSAFPPQVAWRVLFGLGLVPALLILYVRRAIPERRVRPCEPTGRIGRGFLGVFAPEVLRVTILGALIGTGAHGGYHALMTWLPTYLKTERGLTVSGAGASLAVVIAAFWCGCIASSHLQDAIGRRKNLIAFAVCCTGTVLAYIFAPLSDIQKFFLGFPLGFFAAGIPSTLGTLFNELYPQEVRGAGVGFCYNFGRIVSAAGPALVGAMSHSMPLGAAIGIIAAGAYGLLALAVLALPETRGKRLERSDDGYE